MSRSLQNMFNSSKSILGDGNTTAATHLSIHCYLSGATKNLQVNYKANGIWTVRLRTDISTNSWHHCILQSYATGNTCYLNGTELTGGEYTKAIIRCLLIYRRLIRLVWAVF